MSSLQGQQDAERAEEQIRMLQRDVDYQVREYPIEVVVQKYISGRDTGKNEIFVPDYQRDLVWDDKRQSRFVESLLIGLPIPYIFVADVSNEDEELAGRLEIVDGTQRIRTLARFLSNELRLQSLEKLTELNGFTFERLAPSRQRRFKRITLRMIELTEQATEETRRDMFERINTGASSLNPMETRRGVRQGRFIELVQRLAKEPRFIRLAPMSDASERRFEREELVSRFFAFRDRYNQFGTAGTGKVVAEFVDLYVTEMNKALEDGSVSADEFERSWIEMLDFVEKHVPLGFAKKAGAKSTPRVRFEAISVGSALALMQRPALAPSRLEWLDDQRFKDLITSDAANNRTKVVARIEFVRDRILAP